MNPVYYVNTVLGSQCVQVIEVLLSVQGSVFVIHKVLVIDPHIMFTDVYWLLPTDVVNQCRSILFLFPILKVFVALPL